MSACTHPGVVAPARPVPDWVSAPCPDCGERCTHDGRGGFITIREYQERVGQQYPEVRLAAAEAECDRLRRIIGDLYVQRGGDARELRSAIRRAMGEASRG